MADFCYKTQVSQLVNGMAMGKMEKHKNNLCPDCELLFLVNCMCAPMGWTHLLMKGLMPSPVMGAMDMGIGSGVDSQYE